MHPDFVVNIIAAAGGEVVGRTRLQKLAYLLDQLGQNSGLHFSYHHYGPYSEELSSAVDFAKYVEGSVSEKERSRKSDGARYGVFSLSKSVEPEALGKIPIADARRYLRAMQQRNSTVLELAATIRWLRENERVEDWREELQIRKGAKTGSGRMDQAVALLTELGLAPG